MKFGNLNVRQMYCIDGYCIVEVHQGTEFFFSITIRQNSHNASTVYKNRIACLFFDIIIRIKLWPVMIFGSK